MEIEERRFLLIIIAVLTLLVVAMVDLSVDMDVARKLKELQEIINELSK